MYYIYLARCFCCWNDRGDLANVVFFSKRRLRVYHYCINRKKPFFYLS